MIFPRVLRSEKSGAGVPGSGIGALAAFAGCGMLVLIVRAAPAAAVVSAVVPRWKNARLLPVLLLWALQLVGVSCGGDLSIASRGR